MARPKRALGQHFLVDPNLQRRIADALEPGPDDEVLEIGPGTGALTRHLAGRVRRLVAVELDPHLAEELRRELAGTPGVEIVHADILQVDPARLAHDPARLKIIGNIPYAITTPLLFHLLATRPRPARIVVMVQREVADRILAPPGHKEYGALSVGVRTVADVRRLLDVGRGAFRPAPDVDSTVLLLTPRQPPPLAEEEEDALRQLTRAAFRWRRKQLRTILRGAPEYALGPAELDALQHETGIRLDRRPETLAPEEFVRLARALRALRARRQA